MSLGTQLLLSKLLSAFALAIASKSKLFFINSWHFSCNSNGCWGYFISFAFSFQRGRSKGLYQLKVQLCCSVLFLLLKAWNAVKTSLNSRKGCLSLLRSSCGIQIAFSCGFMLLMMPEVTKIPFWWELCSQVLFSMRLLQLFL